MKRSGFVRKCWAFCPPLLWMGVIFFLSSRQRISVSDVTIINFVVFKTLHVIEYAILYLLVYRAQMMEFTPKKPAQAYGIPLLIVAFWGLADELHQTFVPTREGTIRDAIIDVSGGLWAAFMIRSLSRRLSPRLKHLLGI